MSLFEHCGDLQCAVATWTLWTLCTLFDGDSSNSRDTLDTAVDNGLQCESWLFCALAKIFCKNHSGNPHSKASAPNTNWRLQMEKASLPPSWYFREVVRKNLLLGQLASWPDRINVYPSWNEKNNQKCSHIISLTNWRASDKPKQGIHGLFKENLACVPFVLKLKKKRVIGGIQIVFPSVLGGNMYRSRWKAQEDRLDRKCICPTANHHRFPPRSNHTIKTYKMQKSRIFA